MAPRKKKAPHRDGKWWHSSNKDLALYRRARSPRARGVTKQPVPPPRRLRKPQLTRRGWYVTGSVVAAVLALALFVVPRPSRAIISLVRPALAPDEQQVPSSVAAAVSGVTVRDMVLASEHKGVKITPPVGLPDSAARIATGNKPELLYMCNEYNGYCADLSWPLVMALDKFGSFDRLGYVMSRGSNNPGTVALDFYASTYSSKYLSFVSDEMYTTRLAKPDHWQVLQTPTAAENVQMYDWDVPPYASPAHAIPFLDFGGHYYMASPGYRGQDLEGLSEDAAQALSGTADELVGGRSSSAVAAQDLAAHIVGAICLMTGKTPPPCHGLPKALEEPPLPSSFYEQTGAPS